MELDDRITVSTPEGVDLDLVVAGVGSRFMSSLVDSAVQAVVILPLLVLGGATAAGPGIASVGGFLVIFGYPTVCDAFLDGRTLGRRATGLRLVTVDGGPVGFLAAAVRNIVRLVDFLPAFYSVGAIVALATARHQRLGDLAAGTVVVRASGTRGGPVVPGASRAVAASAAVDDGPAVALPEGAGAWDLTRVTAEDLSVVRSFLARRPTLDPAARARVAAELARRLRPAVVGPDPSLPDEALLEAVLAAKTARG
ncbi:RDD family protein [Iamia sp. SCSIO 61187]|uniref:RDD family protein n=1 Tax=Iamia sp. SCSIO 61187 TaxID=2722752 RepID=UPI001C630571|nr:RDD family protein [Iamia sp. SCSIO 61187]QYG92393.1 RDD family protein [Iamia sp. SCSIO 61187]